MFCFDLFAFQHSLFFVLIVAHWPSFLESPISHYQSSGPDYKHILQPWTISILSLLWPQNINMTKGSQANETKSFYFSGTIRKMKLSYILELIYKPDSVGVFHVGIYGLGSKWRKVTHKKRENEFWWHFLRFWIWTCWEITICL